MQSATVQETDKPDSPARPQQFPGTSTAAHQVVVCQHAPHGEGEGDGDGEGQALRHSHNLCVKGGWE